ncbi:hypothetical protein BBJ28_00017622 [Nothophytophthora sp. Chile5]|nr:hypothetical protein BBJ28_00017622 [Nothophytophthora sp. Chile5]
MDATPREAQATAGPLAKTAAKYTPGKRDVYFLGITIVIGGQYLGWNEGVSAGFYSFLIAFLLIASAYITLCCCLAEITGALPFAGGSYGLARCTLGFYPAFMIGCSETLEYTAYVSAAVVSLGQLLTEAAPGLEPYRPLLWLLFYATALFFHIKGDRVFWLANLILGIASLSILVLYCLGSLPYVSFSDYAVDSNMEFVDGFSGFMKALPLAAWFFVGVEALSLASDQADQPKQIIPVAQVSCIVTLFVTGLAVFLVTVSLPPGLATLPSLLFPLENGFALLFHSSRHTAILLALPATYATAFGFMWCYGKLIVAMGKSGLLLPFVTWTTLTSQTPYAALLLGSACSYALCLIVYFEPSLTSNLFGVCMLSASTAYVGQCVGYIALKRNYRNIKSSAFRSPWGIAGAVYSIGVWLLTIVAIVAFQDKGLVDALGFLFMISLLSLYYFGYARKRQTFSAEENRVMLVAHVTKFNANRVAVGRQKRQLKSGSDSRHGSKPATKGATKH